MKQRIVICGGTGMIGSALSDRLKNSGYEVVVVSRKPAPGETSWDDLPTVLEEALAVVNLAGRPIACKFTEENKRAILESRVKSTQKVGEAILQCNNGPRKWINASAVGIYGDRGEELLTESSSLGTGFVADVCRSWEAACTESKANVEKTMLRFAVVLSPKSGALAKLILLTKLFLGGHVGKGQQWMAWVAVSDLTRLIQHAIENKTPMVVNACAPNPVRNRDLMSWLRARLHRPWSPPVPALALEVVGRTVGPDASLLLASSRVVSEWNEGFRYEFPNLESLKLSDI